MTQPSNSQSAAAAMGLSEVFGGVLEAVFRHHSSYRNGYI